MSTFESILDNLSKKYQQEYGIAVFDIEAKNAKSGIVIKGKVLTENQRDEVLEKLKKDTRYKIQGYKIKDSIKVLSNLEERNEIDWAVARRKIIDLKSRFVSSKIINEKILNRVRCSQALKNEILRVLYKHENQLLVQQSDLTLGWVDKSDIIIKKKNLYKEWRKWNYALKNKVLNLKNILKCHPELVSESIAAFKKDNPIQDNQNISGIKTKQSVNQEKILKQVQNDNSDSLQNKIIKEAEKYLGVKYVLGGKSKKGIDCSGLVQIAYKNSLDIILPKHSWDQKKFGKKIKLENIKTGDLVFLVKKNNKHKHVGIAEVVVKRIYSPEVETMEPAISSVISSISEKSVILDISKNLDFSRGAQNDNFKIVKVNLIHASLDKKEVVRQDLEEVFKSYDFAEARRMAE